MQRHPSKHCIRLWEGQCTHYCKRLAGCRLCKCRFSLCMDTKLLWWGLHPSWLKRSNVKSWEFLSYISNSKMQSRLDLENKKGWKDGPPGTFVLDWSDHVILSVIDAGRKVAGFSAELVWVSLTKLLSLAAATETTATTPFMLLETLCLKTC